MPSFNLPTPEGEPERHRAEEHSLILSALWTSRVSLEGLTPEEVSRQLAEGLIQRNGPLPLSSEGLDAICRRFYETIVQGFSAISDRLGFELDVDALYGCLAPNTEATVLFEVREKGSDERIALSTVGGSFESTSSPLFCGMLISFYQDSSDGSLLVNSRPVLDPRLFEKEYMNMCRGQKDCFLLKHINLSAEEEITRVIAPFSANGEKEFLLGFDDLGNSYLIHMLFYERSGELLHPVLFKLGEPSDVSKLMPNRTVPSDSLVDCFRSHMKMGEMEELDFSKEDEALVEHIKEIAAVKLRNVLGANAVPQGCKVEIESIFVSSSDTDPEGSRVDSYQILVGVCDEDLNYYLPGNPPVKSETFAGHILRLNVTQSWSPLKESVASHLQSLRWWIPVPESFMGLFDSRKVHEVSGYDGSLVTSQLMHSGLVSLARLESGGCFFDAIIGKAEQIMKERGFIEPQEKLLVNNVRVYFQDAPYPETRGVVAIEHQAGLQIMEIDLNFPFSYFDFVNGVEEAAFFLNPAKTKE